MASLSEDNKNILLEPTLKLTESKSIGWCMKDRTTRLLLCVALFFIIVGIRFLIIKAFGIDLPFQDQWDSDAGYLYRHYFDGTLTLKEWFVPNNEHRVFFTRLHSLALLVANGQWDGRLQIVTNAVFYSLFACSLFFLLTKPHESRFKLALSIVIALIFTLPFGFENTLWGYQSQFYFLAAFSLATIWLLVNKPVWTLSWIAGCLIGLSCLFTMASGFMAAAAVMGVLFCIMVRERKNWRMRLRELWPTCAICILIICAGLMLMVKVEGHAVYQAHSIAQFTKALGFCLSWPSGSLSPWWALANWLPFTVLAVFYLKGRVPEEHRERFILGVGIWVLLQAVATSLARSTIVQSPRYADMLSLGFLVNFMSMYLVAKGRVYTTKAKFMFTILAMVWLVANSLGFLKLTTKAVNGDLPYKDRFNATEMFRTAAYVINGDIRWLTEGVKGRLDIPYPDPQRLSVLLQTPDIRRILPVSVREPLFMKVRFGNPLLSINSSLESLAPPYYGEKTWGNKASGSNKMSEEFECAAQKKLGLPFIFLYVTGDYSQLFVTDAKNKKHPIVPLLSKSHSQWLPAYAYCPGPIVQIGATSIENSAPVAFSEPKEMGLLSLCALVITNNATIFIVTGAVLFCLALVFSVLRLITPTSAETREEKIHA